MLHARVNIADVRFGNDGGYDSSSSGGSSPASSHSGPSESDGSSSTADEFCSDLREFRRHGSNSSSSSSSVSDSLRPVSDSFACVLDDIDKHQKRMLLLLPAFSSSAGAGARADALSRWLVGFDVGWVLDMDASGWAGESLPRREVGRRVRAWAQALSTMERVFRLRHRELTAAQVTALGELAAATASAMLKLASTVAALGSSPSKLLAVLDMYVPVSEAFPVLGRLFSWGPSHAVSVATEATLTDLVDAARRCGYDLRAFIRSHYPWRMPQGGEVHPCVGFWMGYFRCMLRNRISLCFVLGSEDDAGDPDASPLSPGAEGGLSLVTELILCLEDVLEEKSAALAFPGLRQVFMLNNTFAIVRRAMRSDLKLFLPPEWVRVREERMKGYMMGYVDASWAPVVSRLDGGGTKPSAVLRRRINRLSTFYSALENACVAQRRWKVPNPVLRGVLRKIVSENVVPAYRRYLEDHPEVEVAAGRTAEELEQQLSELFEG
ncbi:exocyst complex component EXO70B2-like [Phragmites australis]|uniref:exocyst complex component EXO70B2-like n=1 Tax=Phragmites australis TaxID=29695 RepID=UPI002D78CABF|nr:exocyst complex component EXO70B2-like [Phragmites australis]